MVEHDDERVTQDYGAFMELPPISRCPWKDEGKRKGMVGWKR